MVQDLAALNKAEMLVWDQWGILNEEDPLRRGREIDELARQIAEENSPPDTVAEWSRRDGFRVTPTVTSYTPTREEPLEADVRAVLDGTLAS